MAAHIPDPINSSGISERNYAVIARKERLESMVRAKRLCSDRVPLFNDMKDEEQSILDAQTSSTVEELKSVVASQDEVTATEVAWVAVHISIHVDIPTSWLVKHNVLQLLVQRLATSNSLQLLRPVLYILGNLVAADSYPASAIQVSGEDITGELVEALVKCLTVKSDRQVLKKEAAWVLYNVAAGSVQHKQLIYNSGAVPKLADQLSNPKLELKKEAAYVLVYLCIVPPAEAYGEPVLLMGHFNRIARRCLPAFIDLAKSPDVEATTLGLQFIGLTLSVMPNDEGKKLVELHGGMDIIEGCQFCENHHLQNMAYALLQKFFGDEFEFLEVHD